MIDSATKGRALATSGCHPNRGMTSTTGTRTIARMASTGPDSFDVVVIGGGPAGVIAALRAARLGARTALLTRDALGGMAATDGPVPVRTLAHAARLMREARQLPRYGITAGELVARLSAAARSRERGHCPRPRPRGSARGARAIRGDRLRARGCGVVHRPARDRERTRAATAVRQGHHLHGRHVTPTRDPGLRADQHAQRRLEPPLGACIDACDRRRRDRRASRLDLQRVRVKGHSVRSRTAHPDERGRGCRDDGQRRAGRLWHPGRGGRRDHRALRTLPHRRAADLRQD